MTDIFGNFISVSIASEKREPPAQPILQSSPGPLQSIIQLPQFIFQGVYMCFNVVFKDL